MANTNINQSSETSWNGWEKIAFRFFFIYFIVQAVPLDWKYYRDYVFINWANVHYADIFNLARYYPRFVDGPDTYLNWGIAALIALAGAAIWSFADRKNNNYENAYYWLRVILRYRLAIGLLAYGFIKLFPLQAPYPSISNLNTNYGDLTDWKLFALSLGIVPSFQSFLGFIEILAAVLLLYRKTTSIGAFIILAFTGNVVMSNLAYEGGESIYSLYLVVIALFLFTYDLRRLFDLLVFERAAHPNRFNPIFTPWLKNVRLALKSFAIFFFVFFYGYKTYDGYKNDPYKYPADGGLSHANGLYNVSQYIVNNDTIPYSTQHPSRWRDVVIEEWPTISIRSNRPVAVDRANVEVIPVSERERTFEFEGAAGRNYFHYEADTINHVLVLQNRNKANQDDRLTLRYDRPDSNTILLEGVDEHRDSIRVVLNRLDKKYLLEEARKAGRRSGLKL